MKTKKLFVCLILAMLICCAFVSYALAVQSIEITSVVDHGDGRVTIHWDNPNGGTVTVGSMVTENEEAGNRILVDTDIPGNSYTFDTLAPGLEHILLVMPEYDLDHAGFDVITVQEPPVFDHFRLTLKESYLMYAVFKDGGDYTYNYAKDLSPQKIYELIQDQAFLVRLDFRHPTFSNSKKYPILTVVTSPTGYVMTDYRDVTIPANCNGFWQTTLHMNNALMTMYENHGQIPSGRYDVKVYIDGAFVGETAFSIK